MSKGNFIGYSLTSSGEVVPLPLGGGDSGSSVLLSMFPDSGSSAVSLGSGVMLGRDVAAGRTAAATAGPGGGGSDETRGGAGGAIGEEVGMGVAMVEGRAGTDVVMGRTGSSDA
jgi:hypothetical protein